MTESLDLFLTHGLTCTLPSCQILLDTLEEVFGLGQKTSRDKQIRFSLFFFFFFFEQGENDAGPWIGEKPAPLTRVKTGSSQQERTCLHFSLRRGAWTGPLASHAPQPLAQLYTATTPTPGRGGRGLLSPCSEMSLGKPL